VREDDDALDRWRGGELLHLRPYERCEDLGILPDLVDGRQTEIFIATVPEPAAVFDPTAQMLKIDEDDSIGSYDCQIDFPMLSAPGGLAHDEVGESLPCAGKRASSMPIISVGCGPCGRKNSMSTGGPWISCAGMRAVATMVPRDDRLPGWLMCKCRFAQR
jgi:hypothetical protein